MVETRPRSQNLCHHLNFGDLLVACITITALTETGARYGTGKAEAAWVRMYGRMWTTRRQLEEIVTNGGFTFKEALM